MYRVVVGESIRGSIQTLPAKLQERLLRAAYRLEANPRPSGSKKLSGKDNLYRIRVGDYRIVYHVNDRDRIVTITVIAHRREVYRGL